jgi:hypothetical protein
LKRSTDSSSAYLTATEISDQASVQMAVRVVGAIAVTQENATRGVDLRN